MTAENSHAGLHGAAFGHGFEDPTVFTIGPDFPDLRRYIPKQERDEMALEVNTTLCGVDRFLLGESDGKEFLIDMYNIPAIETRPIPVDEGIKVMREHAKTIDEKLEGLPPEWEVKRDELTAAAAYLEERSRGQKTPYNEYLRIISGIRPQEIPPATLEMDRRKLVSLLKMAGYPQANGENGSLQEAYQEYHARKVISGIDDLKNGLTSAFFSFRAKLAMSMRRPDLLTTEFSINVVEEDAPFMAWERILPEGKRLDVNYDQTKREQWDWAEIERYARHEGKHFIMGDIQAKEIREGRLDSIAGYILIPGPACWAMEGVAQAVDELTGIQSNEDGRISTALYRMYVRARNNALLHIETGQKTKKEAIEFMQRYAPQKSDEELASDIEKGTEDPMWRAYLPVYGHSDWKIMGLIEDQNAGGKRGVLAKLTSRPMTYSQFREEYGNLAA